MITNFENITYDLTDDEKLLLPLVSGFLERIKSDKPVKEAAICDAFNDWLPTKRPDIKVKLTGARLRKMINRLRNTGTLPVIGTSKGYYVSYDKEELRKQIESLKQRADSINAAADGLMKFLNN